MRISVLKCPTSNATLTCYLADEVLDDLPARPAILICPGGGYEFVSPREGEPIALKYLTAGIQAFVLNYSVSAEDEYPADLCEAMWAMGTIRANSESYHIDPKKIAVCGFSAGGHLAAHLSVAWKRSNFAEKAGFTPAQVRPDAAVLCYPVITSGEFAHVGSIKKLLGKNYGNTALMDEVSLEKLVDDDTPTCFLWHTDNDTCVPVQNSLLFAAALSAHKVPYALHIFEDGPHGLSLALKYTSNDQNPAYVWADMSIEWLNTAFKL